MYGFGDDKQPAADTVAVMEEILIEYIVDVVSTILVPYIQTNRINKSLMVVPDGHCSQS